MTLNLDQNRITYAGNGSSTAFTVPFYFLQNADLTVYLHDTMLKTNALQALTTNYTVTGAGSTNPVGGTVTFLVAPPTGQTVVIFRQPDKLQTLHPQDNSAIPAADLETALDKLEMHAQRVYEDLGRCVRLPPAQTETFDPHLPVGLAGSLGVTLLTDSSTGTTLVVGPTGDQIAGAQTSATNAAASATAAATSATAAAGSATSAASSATSASTSASAASTSATNAASSATSASSSASSASTSATNAAASATTATTQASNASTSATNAASSATSASTSATNAASSASAAATSATNAASSATSAAASAATAGTAIFNQGVVNKTGTYSVVQGDTGKLITADATSASFTITLPQISTLTLPFQIGVFQTNSNANTVTLQRSGSDTINGATSTALSLQYSGYLLTCTGTTWDALPFGIVADGSVTNAKVASAAGIAYSKLALTGAILNADLAGSIADGKLATSYTKADGTRAFTGDQDHGNNRVTGVKELRYQGQAGAPASFSNGGISYDTTKKIHIAQADQGTQNLVGCVYQQTSDTAAITGTGGANFDSNAQYQFPAGSLNVAGRKVRVKCQGRYSTGGTAGTLLITANFGGTQIANNYNLSYTTSKTNLAWQFYLDFVVKTVGTSGTIFPINGYKVDNGGSTSELFFTPTSNTTFNLTLAQTLQINANWNATGNSITCCDMTVEILQ